MNLYIAVFPGGEKLDIGPKRVAAIVSSQKQADALISALWPTTGYWEYLDETSALVKDYLTGAWDECK